MKGHTTANDVAAGRVAPEDKEGNDGADALAVEGAAVHRVNKVLVGETKARKRRAKRVQLMMLDINEWHLARWHAHVGSWLSSQRGRAC